VPAEHLTAWRGLTESGKTLYANRITDPDNVVVSGGTGPVTNTAGSATVTYAGAAIDLSTVSGLFTIDANAGTPTYSIETDGSPTGEGSIASDGKTLTVTKAGTLSIGLVTASTATHAAGTKVTATLTVDKGSQTAPTGLGSAGVSTDGGSDGKITGLSAGTAYEYKKDSDSSYTSVTSNADGEITGLAAGSYVVRLAANDLYNESPDSEAVVIGEPAVLGGTVTITGTATFGETLTAQTTGVTSTPETALGTLSYQWKRGATDIGADSETYTLVAADVGATITITVTAENCTGSVTSSATGTVAKASQVEPSAPTLAAKTATSITLVTIAGAEYQQGTGAWQDSPEFSGLTPNTSYTFYARLKATATHNASPSSTGATFATDKLALTGTVTIAVNTNTGAATASVTGSNATDLNYVWSSGNTTDTQAITGLLGEELTVTATDADGDKSGSVIGTITVYQVTVTPQGATGTDAAAITDAYGKAGDSISVAYTLDNTGTQSNTLTYSGAASVPAQVTAPGSSTSAYTIAATDATGGVIALTATFAHTDTPDAIIDIAALGGISAPVAGNAPVVAITETAQYTGTVAWSPVVSDTFAYSTVYTATITLTPKAGYALTGVAADFFTVAGATTATNSTDSGIVVAVFPATEAAPVTVTGVVVAPSAPSVQQGTTQQFVATVNGTNSPPQTVTWSVTGGTGDTAIDGSGLLGVDANETATTLTVTATSTYDTDKSCTTTVTVTVAPPAPTYGVSLDTGNHTFPAATEGYGAQSAKTVTVTNTGNQATGPLSVSLSGAGAGNFTASPTAIDSIAAGGHATFTVAPVTGLVAGTYTATVTISGANGISAGFDVTFTVNATPPVLSSDKDVAAVIQPAGANINGTDITASASSSTVSLTVALTVSTNASWKLYSDAACISEITNKTMALTTGANTAYVKVTAEDNSEKVYTLTVTRAEPAPVEAADVTDVGNTGVAVTGTVKNVPEGAEVKGTVRSVASGTAYDRLVAEAKKDGATVLGVYEVTLTFDGVEIHSGFGTLTLALPAGAAYEGRTATVWHLYSDGTATGQDVLVSGGKVTIQVTDLFVFAVAVKSEQSGNNTDNTSSGNTSGTLVTGSSSTGSSSSSSSGTSRTSTSQSSAGDDEDTDTADDDANGSVAVTLNERAVPLSETDVPLSVTDVLDEAGADQQSGMNPWALAALIGLVVVALGAVLWLVLRRRRRLAETLAEKF
jgi:hypothetical protein